jgi:hypothetical protein
MLVWVNVVYSAKLVSEVMRPVHCEHCRTEYVYRQKLVSRARSDQAFGIGGEPDFRRKLTADQEDQRKETFVSVPCPKCFRYPDYMAEWLRNDLADGRLVSGVMYLLGTALVAGLAGLFAAVLKWELMALLTWVGAGFLSLMTIIYMVLWSRGRNYDANADRYLSDRQDEAEDEAMTREQFEEQEREGARKALTECLEFAEEWPRKQLDPVLVPVWLGFPTTTGWKRPRSASVTLPTGEEYEFNLPDDVAEFDSFDLKRTVDGVRVVFRVQVRFYHPTRLPNTGESAARSG